MISMRRLNLHCRSAFYHHRCFGTKLVPFDLTVHRFEGVQNSGIGKKFPQCFTCRHFHQKLIVLHGEVDRYNGITVDLANQLASSVSLEEFHGILKNSLIKWRSEGRGAVWITMPLEYCQFIAVAALEGFKYHHAENERCMLKLWLKDGPDATPRFATHQLGVCGIVLRENTHELLVIQDRKSEFTLWKFPGGLANLGEDIEFASVIAFRQQHRHPGAFGRSDLYVVCRLRPLTFDIVPCNTEVLKCQWMGMDELVAESHISSLTRRLVTLLRHGLEKGFDNIDLTADQMQSLYKGLTYTFFSRHISP